MGGTFLYHFRGARKMVSRAGSCQQIFDSSTNQHTLLSSWFQTVSKLEIVDFG